MSNLLPNLNTNYNNINSGYNDVNAYRDISNNISNPSISNSSNSVVNNYFNNVDVVNNTREEVGMSKREFEKMFKNCSGMYGQRR